MRVLAVISLLLLISCGPQETAEDDSTQNDSTSISKEYALSEDSIQYWMSSHYLENLQDTISICDCWRKTRFHLLDIDTVEMNLHIQSNLFHFGMDSQGDFPLLREGYSFRSDTSQENFINELISFEYPTDNTFDLMVGEKPYTFIKTTYPKIKDAVDRYGGYGVGWDLWDQSAILNSTSLLKYDEIDSANTNEYLFSVDSLQTLVKSGLLRSGCSDDFYYDHMGYKNKDGEHLHYHLDFIDDKLIIYQTEGRDRGLEVIKDENRKQVFSTQKN